MSKMKSLSLSLSATALLGATPALADIDADQLWTLWQQQAAEYGYTLTAQAAPTGTGLTLTGLTSTFMVEEVSISAIMDQVTMTNQPDGSVAISMGDTMLYRVSGFDDADAPDSIDVLLGVTGFAGTASGSPENLTLATGFTRVEVTNVDFVGIDPAELPEMDYAFALDGYSETATYDFSDPASMPITNTTSLDALTFAFEAFEPEDRSPAPMPMPQPTQPAPGKLVTPTMPQPVPGGGGNGGGHIDMAVELTGIQATAQGTIPRGLDWMALDRFPAGMAFSGDASYGSAMIRVLFSEGSDNFDFAASNGGGEASFALSQQQIRYAVSANTVAVDLAASDMPFPVSVAADSTRLAVDMPLARAEAPSPFSAAIAYQGVTVDESLWAMLDPGQAVPRTPASLVVDLSGTVQLFVDLMMMEPEQMAQMTTPPGELRDLTLNNLRVAFGGAELTGSGDVDFAPGQIVPMPVGTVNLSLTGANGLIQSLSAGGLLPPEQAGMARGMLGMFGVPGATADSYSSTIEFTPDGRVTANGVPLQ